MRYELPILPACRFREIADSVAAEFVCHHDRVFATDGRVTAEVCATCAQREAPPSEVQIGGTAAAEPPDCRYRSASPVDRAERVDGSGVATAEPVYHCRLFGRCAIGKTPLKTWEYRTLPRCVTCPERVPATRHDRENFETQLVPTGPREIYECDVVMPYYHNLQWVPEAVESVLRQQSVRLWLHLVNDASPEDDTFLKRLYGRCDNILWYRNRKNLGPHVTVNQLYRHLRTEFIAIADSDDISYPNRLWLSLRALHAGQAGFFGASAENFLDPSVPPDAKADLRYVQRFPIMWSGIRFKSCPEGYLTNPTVVMRKSALKELNGYHDLICGGDTELCARARRAGIPFIISDAVLVARRVNHQSISRGEIYGQGRPLRTQLEEHITQLHTKYAQPGFDPRRFGCLDRADASLTIPDPPEFPYQPFVIVSEPRTGSNMLYTSLDRHPQVVCHPEVLHPNAVSFGVPRSYRDFPSGEAYLREAVYRRDAAAQAVGFKLLNWQGREAPADDTRAFLERIGAKVVLTRRRNLLRGLISKKIAAQTDLWARMSSAQPATTLTIRLDPPRLVEELQRIQASYAQSVDEFSGCEFLVVWYEDLVNRYEEQMQRVFRFLGVIGRPTKPATLRQETRPLDQIVENHSEVAAALRGTPWERCLEETLDGVRNAR